MLAPVVSFDNTSCMNLLVNLILCKTVKYEVGFATKNCGILNIIVFHWGRPGPTTDSTTQKLDCRIRDWEQN